VDLYQLVGEIAGINVHKAVPWAVDSVPMLPYLRNPKQASLRKSNFTQIGTNLHANQEINGPCVYNGDTCTQIAPSKGVCEDNNGEWWGEGSTVGPSDGLAYCCDVAIYQHDNGLPVITDIYPLEAHAIRNDNYKIVVNSTNGYDTSTNTCVAQSVTEFYQINE